MPINDITQTISELPPAGHRGVDVQTVFVIKQEDFQDHLQGTTVDELNTFKDQLNSRIGEINSTATTMNGYASSASTSASTATTKAGEALTYRNQAETFKNEAETYRNQAETFKNEAETSATNAIQAITLDTIEDLATYTGTGLCMIKDINRGGTFISKTAIEINPKTGRLYVADGGTVFPKLGGGFWARQFNGNINVKKFGVCSGDDFAITNCDNYAKLIAYVKEVGGNVNIQWDADINDYQFSPKDNANFNTSDNSWRIACEIVDLKNVYHFGWGAKIKVNADSTWTRGNSNTGSGAVAIGMDESPIQFRSTVADACSHVGVYGLEIYTDITVQDSTATYSDGGAFGISYRGCSNTITVNPKISYFGTDAIYYGTGYSNSPKGKNHYLLNPILKNNYRQGISVAGNNDGVIVGGEISDTKGSTFGYAIDFETNVSKQSNWTITGLKTKNNERGACNHIRSEHISWYSCEFDEQSESVFNAGCIRADGSSSLSELTNSIYFEKCKINGYRATLYFNGNYVDNIKFNKCEFKTTGDVSVDSQFRLNTSNASFFGTVEIKNSRISGNGGMSCRGITGGLDTKLIFKNNQWFPSDENSTVQSWIFDTNSEFVYADIQGNTIDFTKNTWGKVATYEPFIPNGILNNNKFESTSQFIINWKDYGSGRAVKIGSNTWGTYSYYKGCSSGLSIVGQTLAIQSLENVAGDFSTKRRIVHGGRKRLIQYIAEPSAFINEQAPRDGDMVWNTGNNEPPTTQIAYVYDVSFGGWRLSSWITAKGTTANRPATAATATYDIGLEYLDTTLAAGGVKITWNGSAWVNYAGTVV